MQEQAEAEAGEADDALALDLTLTLTQRLHAELGTGPADEVISCLRTAKTFLRQLETDPHGLRLAASAAYNLREALNRIVSTHDPAEGGLQLVLTAWKIYQSQIAAPESDRDAAREAFDSVLRSVESDESRASGYARKLITLLAGPAMRPVHYECQVTRIDRDCHDLSKIIRVSAGAS